MDELIDLKKSPVDVVFHEHYRLLEEACWRALRERRSITYPYFAKVSDITVCDYVVTVRFSESPDLHGPIDFDMDIVIQDRRL